MLNKVNEYGRRTMEIRPCNIKDLAVIYGVDRRTMAAWLKGHEVAIGPKLGRYYSVLQVEIILQRLGIPSQLYIVDCQPD
jgi:hypothetical protein